jgi:type III pantothenate kinase
MESGVVSDPLEPDRPLVAIDVGNTRIKLGLFERRADRRWPECREFTAIPRSGSVPWNLLARWAGGEMLPTVIGGSHPAIIEQLQRDWANQRWPAPLVIRNFTSLPIDVDVDVPERVGLDRLLNAVAVNEFRPAGTSAVIVDAGTAINIDVVNPAGAFAGGAILPGLALGARALHEYTALLPWLGPEELRGDAPVAIGRNTRAAMQSGLRWGFAGAVRELVQRMTAETGSAHSPRLVLTGGDGGLLTEMFPEARYFPSLAMHGLALCAWHRDEERASHG